MSKTHLGHTARKRFGQNFLHDDYVIGQIVSAINPQHEQNLVEIGPGLGALTDPVCDEVEALTVIELDRDLAKRLREHPFNGDKLTVIEQDAMTMDFTELAKTMPVKDKGLRVFGNLPYNISTPLLFHLFEFADNIEHMHFMLQKEVVKRMVAGPGSKTFGRLSVMTQYYCNAMPVIEVPPECFKPAPKVDSAVIRLIPKKPEQRTAKSVKILNNVCLEAFNQRRKTLRNSLKTLNLSDELREDTVFNLRPEQLSVEEFIELTKKIEADGI